MTAPLNRHNAASRARAAQALLGVLVVGGGAALAVGLKAGPRAEVPASGKLELPIPEVAAKAGTTRTVALDTGGTAERLNLIINAPKAIEVPPVAAQGEQPKLVQPTPAELRYLGAVMGSKNMALVSDAGKQRFVAIGDTLAGGQVESISDSQIKIGGDSPRTIELASRGGDVLTKGHRPGGPGQPGQPGVAINRPGVTTTQQGLTVLKSAPQPVLNTPGGGGVGLNGEE